ncbi:MAG: hypothetical protein ABIK07_13410 [Planctomycetota bacterium]
MAKNSSKKSESVKKPEKVFRIGFVSASVFAHEIETDEGPITIRSVSVQKRYKDGDDVKYTSSFNLAELPQAVRALQLAQSYVERAEAEIILD